MGLFDIFKNKKANTIEQAPSAENIDWSEWTGQDFEFLIVGNIEIKSDFDTIFTPKSMEWHKTTKNNWDYYQVDQDEFSYSIEEPGIQMIFNKEIPFEKAKKIADEVIANIIASGQQAELLILDNTNVYGFD